MRTREEILQEITQSTETFPQLEKLEKNPSNVSFWQSIKQIFAMAIFTLEHLFEKYKQEVFEIIDTTEPGSAYWYRKKALEYQQGDNLELLNNSPSYAKINPEKQIIKRVSIKENPSGGFMLKVAKTSPEGGLEKLTKEELDFFILYIQKIKFLGIPIECVSRDPDVFYLDIEVEVDKMIYKKEGEKLIRISDKREVIKETIEEYLKNFPFDQAFYISKLLYKIEELDGVKDVYYREGSVNQNKVVRKIEEVEAGYMTLSTQSKINYVFT